MRLWNLGAQNRPMRSFMEKESSIYTAGFHWEKSKVDETDEYQEIRT